MTLRVVDSMSTMAYQYKDNTTRIILFDVSILQLNHSWNDKIFILEFILSIYSWVL